MWPFSDKKVSKEEKKEQNAEKQKYHAGYLRYDKRLREFLALKTSELINEYAPNQQSGDMKTKLMTNVVNIMMPNYNGNIKAEGVLSNVEKDFLPQPGMLEYWAKQKGFEQIPNDPGNPNRLRTEDVAEKYVLTYYPPLANSCAARTTTNLDDTSNKHWYSHCKSSLYTTNDVVEVSYNGNSIKAMSNPELTHNDTIHDATKYVPEDSFSYNIDYERLGLSKEDIQEGFLYQAKGINIMDKNIQDAIFRMNKVGLSQEEIINLWDKQVNLTDTKNLVAIEQHLQNGGKKESITGLELSTADNQYKYNLQDYSCAIQPTAPILYATAAKIDKENLNTEEANKLRENIGLYNIYDLENYGAINKKFYENYSGHIISEFKTSFREDVREFMTDPKNKVTETASNAYHTVSWLSSKTKALFPEMLTIMEGQIKSEQKQEIINKDAELTTKYMQAFEQTNQHTPAINLTLSQQGAKNKAM